MKTEKYLREKLEGIEEDLEKYSSELLMPRDIDGLILATRRGILREILEIRVKNEKEIKEEIESLVKFRDSFVVSTKEWEMFNFAVKKLEWVFE